MGTRTGYNHNPGKQVETRGVEFSYQDRRPITHEQLGILELYPESEMWST